MAYENPLWGAPRIHGELLTLGGQAPLRRRWRSTWRAPWEGNPVTSTNKGGSFYFTTIGVPSDCISTVSDGVTTLDVTIAGCTPVPPVPPAALTPTGQTACYDTSGTVRTEIPCTGTGQDGEIKAGKALSYTNNGDGTITDNNTALMWEKLSDDGTIHDKDNLYKRADAFAVHIAGLNAMNFAGHNDWRLPNVKELQTIVNYGQVYPAISSEFNSNCVASVDILTGSCTGLQLLDVIVVRRQPRVGEPRRLRLRRRLRGQQGHLRPRACGAGRLVIGPLNHLIVWSSEISMGRRVRW